MLEPCKPRARAVEPEGLHLMPPAGTWLHGEAVSAGIVMAADLSYRCGWIEKELLDRIIMLLDKANLPIHPPQVTRTLSPSPWG